MRQKRSLQIAQLQPNCLIQLQPNCRIWETMIHFSPQSTLKMVNRVDKLQLCEVDEKLLLRYGKHKLMNSFVLRIDDVTLQVFLVTKKAMCFSHSVDVVTALLPYGICIKESTLCTSTWVVKLDV